MPLFEYRCENCGQIFEELVFHEDKEVRCPACHGVVQKLMSPFSYTMTDDVCATLPRGEQRELCTECRQGGGACPISA